LNLVECLQVGAVGADRWEETITDMTRRSVRTGTAAAALGSMAATSTEADAPPSGKQAPGVPNIWSVPPAP
jgi:hypothetical protein